MEKEKVSHKDDGFQFKLYQNTTRNGYSYYSHWHNELEIINVKKGTVIAQVNEIKYELKKGDLLFINSGFVHNFFVGDGICDWDTFVFDYNFLSSMLDDRVYQKFILPLLENNYFIQELIISKEVENILIEIADIYHQKKPFYEIKIKSLLYDLFFELYKNDYIIKDKDKTDDIMNKLKQSLDYIYNNYQTNIQVKDIAGSCFLNEFYYMRLFKKYMNMTVNEYLNRYRLQKAINYLVNTNLSVTEIAYKCGFASSSYFIVKLKKMYNKTAKEIRNQR